MIKRLLLAVLLTLPTATAAAEQTVWEVSLWGKPRAFTYHVEQLAHMVRWKTGREFVLNLNYGGLSKPRQNLEGIAAGKFQMAQFCAGYHPEKNRAITALELPFLGVASLEQELAVSKAIYAHPAVRNEMAQWDALLLMPTPLPQYNLVGRGAPPKGTDWFRGKRIRATGGIASLMEQFGAEAISLTATETKVAFESGEIDAVAFAPHAHFAFDTISPAEWWTSNLNPGTVNCPVVVNAEAFAALPEAHRKALLDAVAPAMEAYLANYADLMNKWASVLEVFGKGMVEIDGRTAAALRDAASAKVARAWIADAASAGLPAEALLDVVADELQRNGQ